MAFANQAEAEARVAELEKEMSSAKDLEKKVADLEKENRNLTRESVGRKDAYLKLEGQHSKVVEALKAAGIEDPEGDIKEQIETVSGKPVLEKSLQKYEKRLKDAEGTIDSLMKEKEESTKKLANARITEILTKAMSDVVGAKELIENIILKNQVKEDKGKMVIINEDGDELPPDKFAESFKKANPNRVIVEQKPGSGSTPNSGGEKKNPGNQYNKKITQSEFLKLSVTAKDEFYKQGGHVLEPGEEG
jgi:hypothetical protein